MAQTQNVFCVEMKWLLDCRTSNNRMNEEAYKVPPFLGLHISVSQLEPDERHRIMRLVESNGGKFDRNIEKDITTHLICLKPEGEKYSAAKSWRNVFIVTIEWIDTCVQKQMWIDEIDYPVFTSSNSIISNIQHQLSTTTSTTKSIPSTLSIRAPTPTTTTTISSSSPRTSTSTTPILITQTPRTIPIMKRSISKIRKNIWEQTQSDQSVTNNNQVVIDNEEKKDNIEKISLSWDEDLQYLNDIISSESILIIQKRLQTYLNSNSLLNEVIYVSGFDDKTMIAIVKLINLGSGYRSHILTERVTKCLLGPNVSDRLLHSIITHPLNPSAITLRHLIKIVLPNLTSNIQIHPSISTLSTNEITLKSNNDKLDSIPKRLTPTITPSKFNQIFAINDNEDDDDDNSGDNNNHNVDNNIECIENENNEKINSENIQQNFDNNENNENHILDSNLVNKHEGEINLIEMDDKFEKKNSESDHEYDVEDSSDDKNIFSKWNEGIEDFPVKKRKRWEGGTRKKNNFTQSTEENKDTTIFGINNGSSFTSQSSQFFLHSSFLRSSIGSNRSTPPRLTRNNNNNKSNKISNSSPIGQESQIVVYNADTLPDTDWNLE